MLDRPSAVQIAVDLQRRRPAMTLRRLTVWLEARRDQFPAVVAILQWPSSRQLVEVELRLDGYRIARSSNRDRGAGTPVARQRAR